MEQWERLIRIEEKLEHLTDIIKSHVDAQEEKNDLFYALRDDFLQARASAQGAWWTIGIFGSLTIAVSGVVAWAVSNWKAL